MAETKAAFKTAYGPKQRVRLNFSGTGRTKQSFKDECDINNILAKYQKTGLLEAVNKHQPQYGDVTGLDFQSAMVTIVTAQQMFDDLPSSVRKRFANDPQSFLEFVNNPDNRPEAVKLGLIVEPDPAPEPAPVAPVAPVAPEQEPAPAGSTPA